MRLFQCLDANYNATTMKRAIYKEVSNLKSLNASHELIDKVQNLRVSRLLKSWWCSNAAAATMMQKIEELDATTTITRHLICDNTSTNKNNLIVLRWNEMGLNDEWSQQHPRSRQTLAKVMASVGFFARFMFFFLIDDYLLKKSSSTTYATVHCPVMHEVHTSWCKWPNLNWKKLMKRFIMTLKNDQHKNSYLSFPLHNSVLCVVDSILNTSKISNTKKKI